MPREASSTAPGQASRHPLEAGAIERGEKLDVVTALELLEAGGCPVCRLMDQSMKRFFFWFALEHYLESGTIERVDAALGFCPRHCRTLIRSNFYYGTLTNVYLHVVPAAISRLSESEGDERGPCIGCTHESWLTHYAIGLVVKTLSKPDVAAAYEKAGGFCASHFLDAPPQSTPEQSRMPLEVLEDRLSRAGSDLESVSTLTGTDNDSATRVSFLASLPEDPCDTPEGKKFGAVERLKAAFGHDCCPACLSAGQARRRYLRWIGPERAKNRSGLAREIMYICPAHFADLALLDPDSAEWLAIEKATLWRGVLGRFHRKMQEIPPPELRGRLDALRQALSRLVSGPGTRNARIEEFFQAGSRILRRTRHWRRSVDSLRSEFSGCGACHAGRTASQRMTELLLAGLQDRSVARLFESTHGLCVRHVLALPEEGRPAARDLCRARLGLLAWELREADRKLDWLVRYEGRGREQSAWSRAMAQIDGEVFLGGEPTAATS